MNIDKQEFFDFCEKFDWFYSYSDDGRVYANGLQQERKLESISQQNPEFVQIYKDFRSYAYSGKPWGTEKLPKPKIEDYE